MSLEVENKLNLLHINSVVTPKELPSGNFKFLEGLFDSSEGWLEMFDIAAIIFTIILLLSCVILVMASIFKVGQWQQYAQLSAIFSFIALLGVRGTPFIILAIPTYQQIDNVTDLIILVITQLIILVSIIGIGVSLLYKLGYKLIEHPEFRKNQRAIFTTSLIMLVVGTNIPYFLI